MLGGRLSFVYQPFVRALRWSSWQGRFFTEKVGYVYFCQTLSFLLERPFPGFLDLLVYG